MFRPIPKTIPVDRAKATLGKRLFFDPILSKDRTVSCASCHVLAAGGDDNMPVSVGVKGRKGTMNAPTVYNAVFNFRQFWDGRAADLKEQAKGPIVNPVEMANDFDSLVKSLSENEYYRESFEARFPERKITPDTIAEAIAEYEKTLITPDAPFDRYLQGDEAALTPQQKRGYRLFRSKGCVLCHNGIGLGGNLYNKFGVYKDANSSSLGRYAVTGREEDKYLFKVPSLRNVALTAPYMHDGRFDNLYDAVSFMSQFQLGRYMAKEEIEDIVAFLHALTGKHPALKEE